MNALVKQAKLSGEEWSEIINASDEEWRPVVGFEGSYEVSNKGRVRNVGGKELSIGYDKDGYPRVSLYANGSNQGYVIHRLVAKAFVENPNPEQFDQVNHIDEDKTNNFFMNLEWCDNLYNRRWGTGVQRAAEKKSDAVVATRLDNGETEFYKSMNEAARELCGDSGHISDAVNGKRKVAYGRKWERAERE